MRFMAMVKFDENADLGAPPPALFQAMDEFAQEGARNGTLVDQGGLLPSATGAIVSLVNGTLKTIDGPFAPPLSATSRVSRRKPARCFAGP